MDVSMTHEVRTGVTERDKRTSCGAGGPKQKVQEGLLCFTSVVVEMKERDPDW